MEIGRNILLWGSTNDWMKKNVPNFKFVKRAVKRFIPGETASDALDATRELTQININTTFTYLGENIKELQEAEQTADHYFQLIDRIYREELDIEISLKLTQIGFDLSFNKTLLLFKQIVRKAKECNNNVWIDMEDSTYVDKTIEFYKKIKDEYDNVGLCLQAYLFRTMDDIKNMMDINPWIRLVKGAYNEPDTIVFTDKRKVDENFFDISKYLLGQIQKSGIRAAFATHDINLVGQIKSEAERLDISKNATEFQMLYGIRSREQYQIAEEGYNVRTLISYGEAWYPWYMRRLAERPANVGFIIKNLISK
ncbi:MAG: proline dehydrogenase family protein [Ignavibacterium sp.]|nr:MAG: proline dehydrogenase family protein [Ignavibacterium sp.]